MQATSANPYVSAIICTRNRGASVLESVQALLNSTFTSFELILIDQSTDEATAHAIRPLLADQRLRYIRSNQTGLSRARNEGLQIARGELVVMTDDDCEAPTNWVEKLVAIFEQHPDVVLIYGDVDVAPHDPTQGFITYRNIPKDYLVRNVREWISAGGAAVGIGAAMAMRRKHILSIGGFDPLLGAGMPTKAGEDTDIGLRVLRRGWHIYHTRATSVVHYGFRNWADASRLMRGYMIGVGATHAKLVRNGYWQAMMCFAHVFYYMFLVRAVRDMSKRRVPRVLGSTLSLFRGFVQGWFIPINPDHDIFLDTEQALVKQSPMQSL